MSLTGKCFPFRVQRYHRESFSRIMNQENQLPSELAYGNINEAAAAQDLADRADFAKLDLSAKA